MARERNLGLGGGEPSRDEIRQRVHSLYDHAESATGNFNATRARTAGSLGRIFGTGRGSRQGSDPGTDAIAQQWFNASRAALGPTVPAVLPPDRMPPRPATPPSPSMRPAESRPADPALPHKQLESPRPVAELPAVPEPRLPLDPAGATARPAFALEAAPAAAPPTTSAAALVPAAAPEIPQVLPAPTAVTLPQQAAPAAAPLTALPAVNAPMTEGMWAMGTDLEPAPAPAVGSRGLTAAAFARAQTGKPCVWGATGPDSYDCSSLTRAAWRTAGVDLPRAAGDQAFAGTPVPLTHLQPGDLVFFYAEAQHVGLFVGDGMMVHAPAPGAVIREEPVLAIGEAAVHSAVRPA